MCTLYTFDHLPNFNVIAKLSSRLKICPIQNIPDVTMLQIQKNFSINRLNKPLVFIWLFDAFEWFQHFSFKKLKFSRLEHNCNEHIILYFVISQILPIY